MKRLVRWWLARKGVDTYWLGRDLRAAAKVTQDYGRIPQSLTALAKALDA